MTLEHDLLQLARDAMRSLMNGREFGTGQTGYYLNIIRRIEAELAKPEQKGISSGLCLHPSALNYLDKKKVRTRLDYQPYTGVREALEKELGESNES